MNENEGQQNEIVDGHLKVTPPEIVQFEEPRKPGESAIRGDIAKWVIWTLVGGVTIILSLFIFTTVWVAMDPQSKVTEYYTFENGIKLLMAFGAFIGGPVGYVIAHYFKS